MGSGESMTSRAFYVACVLFYAGLLALLGILINGCKPSMFRVEEINCPIDVPPQIVAAYIGCGYDVDTGETWCDGESVQAPELRLDACDMADGGLCE